MRIILPAILILIMSVSIVFQANIYEFFATRMENAQSNVMQNNINYIRGKSEHLIRLKFEYAKTKDVQTKQVLKQMYEEELSTIDSKKISDNLLFIE